MPDQRSIDAELSSVAPARRWAREKFDAAGVEPAVRDLLVLLVSEVVTNAVEHAAPPLLLRIDVTDEATRVEVEDRARELPILKDPEPSEPGGRGIKFVDDLATRWGTEPPSTPDGVKTVWFEVAHRPDDRSSSGPATDGAGEG
ncbi:ATP-binding protein [uncultured Cellulomonas sp.]|uniref:ATP-binding protein n=1 Tax=uncultured Cellulomonas sp. TaxID=189682 RepID=UPI00261F99D6|nr:ATP-binding protein [uncultured Cellulomonas sp.]